MGKFIDLTGQTFGQLTVIERAENSKGGHARWLCRCTCGNEVVVEAGHLKEGQKTCGCGKTENPNHKTHGMRHTKIYSKWAGMIQRCENPKHKQHDDYGGRLRTLARLREFL